MTRPVARKLETSLEWRKTTWKNLPLGVEKARVQHIDSTEGAAYWIEGDISVEKIPGEKGHKKKVTFIRGDDPLFILENLELKQFQVLRPVRSHKRRHKGAAG